MKSFGVVIVWVVLLTGSAFAEDLDKPIFIEIRCAPNLDGEYERTSFMPISKIYNKMTFLFEKGDVVTVRMDIGEDRKQNPTYRFLDVRTHKNPDFVRQVAEQGIFIRKICLGPKDEKERYLDSLKTNREKLGIKQ